MTAVDGWGALVAITGVALGLVVGLACAIVDGIAWFLVLPNRRPGTLADQLAFADDPSSPLRRLGDPINAQAPDGVPLAGLWHAAIDVSGAGADPGRVVLLIHGFAEDPAALGARMEALNRRGWSVAALDARAHGRSGGDRGSFGGREAVDVSAWLDALAASGRIGARPVALWGRSMGAAIALRAAADDPRVAALVLEAPYTDLLATLVMLIRRRRVPVASFVARLVMRRALRLAGVSLAEPRPVDVVPNVDAPILIIHGSDDALTPVADARLLASAFPRPALLVEVAGAGHHSVIEVGGPPLLERIADFLDVAAGQG